MALLLYAFRFRDAVTGRWRKARYRAELEVIRGAVRRVRDSASLEELTRRTQPAAQARVLRRLGIPFRPHPIDGVLLVAREAALKALGVEQLPPANDETKYEVNLETLRNMGRKRTHADPQEPLPPGLYKARRQFRVRLPGAPWTYFETDYVAAMEGYAAWSRSRGNADTVGWLLDLFTTTVCAGFVKAGA